MLLALPYCYKNIEKKNRKFACDREESSRGDMEADEPWIMTVRGGAGARALHPPTHLPPLPPIDTDNKRRVHNDDPGMTSITTLFSN